MSCNSFVTASLGLSCKNNTGGIQKIFLFDNAVSITESTSGVTAFVGDDPTNLYEWVLPRQTSNITENITSSVENGTTFYETSIVISLIGLSKEKQDQLKLLAHSTTTKAVVRDNSGNYWFVGNENGLDLTSSAGQTGTAFGDRNGYEITLTHIGPTGMKYVDVADDTAFEALFTGTAPDNITLVKA